MNISLERLIEGIIATLRSDVIPHVTEAFARGQAVGVIDVLNSINPRVEWARGPLIEAVTARIAVLEQVRAVLPDIVKPAAGDDVRLLSAAELQAERDRLDIEITEILAQVGSPVSPANPGAAEALSLLRIHMHDELTRDMKLTRKPLFGEISSGAIKPAT